MSYTIRHIAGIVEGDFLRFRGDDAIGHLLLDSRRLIFPASSLFFALRGPRRDGRGYMEELYRRGVRNFVVQDKGDEAGGGSVAGGGGLAGVAAGVAAGARGGGGGLAEAMPDANILLVTDTLVALQRLAAWHRAQFSIPVIAITGSNGKTIVKEWLNQLLEADYHIVRSPKSYNSQTGVPLSVWQLQPAHELAIFEAGISRRAEMRRLEAMIRPTIGIFTNLGEAHSEGFESRAEKAAEKLQLFAGAEVLVYCADQPETVRAIATFAGSGAGPKLFSWGHGQDVTVRIDSIEKKNGWTTIGGPELSFSIPFTDDASIENVMHCVGVLRWLRRPVEEIRLRLQQLAPIAMRLELKSGINHCSIINDSYSADLSSLAIALDFLSQQQQHSRRSVILSDILESGRPGDELYAEVGRALEQKKVDRLIGIGERISAHAQRISEWFSGELVVYPTVEAFRQDLHRLHFHDETILLKGARIFEFEEIDRLLTEQIHQTVMEIDLNAMAGNLRAYRQLLQPATRVMAMVKAFAYGSGSFEIANLLQFHGVDYLGVAYADEGVALRKAGIRMPIMVMNTENSGFDSLVQYNLEPVIYSFPLLRSFDRWLKKEGIPTFPIHIELETGMNRLGFPAQEWDDLLRVLPAAAFNVQSAFSHFAASEEAQQDAFSLRQAEAYLGMAARLEEALGYSFIRHIANSAAIIRLPQLQLDMVRLGIGLYGIDSAAGDAGVDGGARPDAGVDAGARRDAGVDAGARPDVVRQLDLQEVSTLKTTIAQIKHLRDGDTIGYNRRGLAEPGTVIATVRIGYADGYSRNLGNGTGKMWVRGRLAPTIGSISMDLTTIDISGIPDVNEGDEVVVFGKELSVSQLAIWAQTIPYEILTGVSHRVKRIYFE
ncbi:MAG TPA: bifunctional UDP-N-acetylmuramoyl-tripeptide:D-alanyl-D-alanine ligase/alanine racemase [Puia sp.]|nr:bifunctional UDP-N-acetylmuramoyl-tripeptide:D-alanyl-D-alanine ligase/alanine racemase [Puia sp.]